MRKNKKNNVNKMEIVNHVGRVGLFAILLKIKIGQSGRVCDDSLPTV